MTMRKTVAGIKLNKTIDKNHHRWVAKLAGYTVIFTPTLGRYNSKVNGWKGSHHPVDMLPRFGASGGSLRTCVINTQHAAHKARKPNQYRQKSAP